MYIDQRLTTYVKRVQVIQKKKRWKSTIALAWSTL